MTLNYLKPLLNKEITVHLKKDLPEMTMTFYDHLAGTSNNRSMLWPDTIDGTMLNIDEQNNTITIKSMCASGVVLDYIVRYEDFLYITKKTLTVSSLIEKLQALSQDMEIYAYDIENGDYPITDIEIKEIEEHSKKEVIIVR